MKVFDSKNSYQEVGKLLKKKTIMYGDPTPKLTDLPEGDYEAKRYGYTVELKDGKKYKTEYGVRYTKSNCGPYKSVHIKDGKVSINKTSKFSGLTEMGGILQGMSYGKKSNVTLPCDITRLKLDTEGFKIPNKVKDAFQINKVFSMLNKGEFTGNISSSPIVGISKDNSIIRDKRNNNLEDHTRSGQPNAMTNMSLDWNNERSFHLGIEPWMSSPLLSDVDDGIYVGNLKDDKFETKNKTITLAVKMNVDYPESVICLIKNQKAYIFKQSQLTATSGSRIFSGKCPETGCIEQDKEGNWRIISNKTGSYWPQKYESKEKAEKALKAYQANRHFSEITNDSQFRDYARNLMMNAHKDNYSQEKTDKVVDGLLEKHQGSDYGELVGRLKSHMGNKGFSRKSLFVSDLYFADPNDQQAAQQQQQQVQQTQQSAASQGQQMADPQQAQPNNAPNAMTPVQPQQSQNEPQQKQTLTPINLIGDINYTFEYNPSEPKLEMQGVIGTLLMSVTFGHLFHLCTTDYPSHIALNEYYEKMPDKVDTLAEAYLSTTKAANFQVCIVPTSSCPIAYLDRVLEYVLTYQEQKLQGESAFNSLVDDCVNQIRSTLYKLKRLKGGKKLFSFSEEDNVTFSGGNPTPAKIQVSDLSGFRNELVKSIMGFIRKFHKAPLKDLKTTDGKSVRQFVEKHTFDNQSAMDIAEATLKGISDGVAKSLIGLNDIKH